MPDFPPVRTILRNAEAILTGLTGSDARARGDLAMEKGRIAEIGTVAPRPGDRVIDVRGCVIYPGLAFTRGLARLGQGGGYYDRLSAKLRPHCVRIGVCHGVQMIDALPEDAHDVTMHWVVTEATVYPYVPDPPPPAVCAAAGMPLATIGGASGVTSTEDAPERASEPTDRQENP